MKGFMLSVITITMVAILFLMWSSITKASVDFEKGVFESYRIATLSFLMDDIFFDVNKIVGPSINYTQKNDTWFFIADSFPKQNFTPSLEAYRLFVENRTQNQTNANISLEFSKLEDGMIELTVMKEYLVLYNYTSTQYNSMYFFNKYERTQSKQYFINITTSEDREDVDDFNWNGGSSSTLVVNITYSDNNGTVTSSGNLNPSNSNDFEIDYENGGQIEITVGDITNDGEIKIEATNVSGTFSIIAIMNLQENIGIEYNATLDYSTVGIAKNSSISR